MRSPILILTLLCAPGAWASPVLYTFNFTAGDVLNAITSADTAHNFPSSVMGYFAFFLQPGTDVTTYTLDPMNSTVPNAGEIDQWEAVVLNPANPTGLNPTAFGSAFDTTMAAVQFSKVPGETEVALISSADGGTGGANIFLQQTNPPDENTYDDVGGSPPVFFGSSANLHSIIPESAVFQIAFYSDSLTPGATYSFHGLASGIHNSNSSSYDYWNTKSDVNVPFELSLTPNSVPEPGSLSLLGLGIAVLAAGAAWKERKLRTLA